MRKLSREREVQQAELAAKLEKAFSDMKDYCQLANVAIARYNESIGKVNEVMAEAREWRDDIVGDIEGYVEERSEKWQESEKASAYETWKGLFEALELDDLDAEEPLEESEAEPWLDMASEELSAPDMPD